MKKGFTLIELLGVIIILSVIALITVPIVIDMINSSRIKAQKRSIKLYGKAVENAVTNYYLKHKDKTMIPNLELLEQENLIQYKGNKVECNKIKISTQSVFVSECKVDGSDFIKEGNDYYSYGKTTICEATKTQNLNQISEGDKYSCRVKKNTVYDFYVLSVDDKVSLIMDRNICENGQPATSTNPCLYSWENQYRNYEGPIIAMDKLYEATSSWKYIPNIKMYYSDKDNQYDNQHGYNGIYTEGENLTKIYGLGATTPIRTYKNLKARLIDFNEIKKICENGSNICKDFLIENLKYCTDCSGDKYNINRENGLDNIQGYWTLNSEYGNMYLATYVSYRGNYNSTGGNNTTTAGIRAVIQIPISELGI